MGMLIERGEFYGPETCLSYRKNIADIYFHGLELEHLGLESQQIGAFRLEPQA